MSGPSQVPQHVTFLGVGSRPFAHDRASSRRLNILESSKAYTTASAVTGDGDAHFDPHQRRVTMTRGNVSVASPAGRIPGS